MNRIFNYPRAMIGIASTLLAGGAVLAYRNLVPTEPVVRQVQQVGDSATHSGKPARISRAAPSTQATRPEMPGANSLAARHRPQTDDAPTSPYQSETMNAFLLERDRLQRDQQKSLRGLVNLSPEEQHQALEKWHEENAAALAAQQELAVRMGAESRSHMLRVPTTPRIPGNATPELRQFLTARHAVMKDHSEMIIQIHNFTPEGQHQVVEKWHEQNGTRLEAMQTATTRPAESLSQPRLPEH